MFQKTQDDEYKQLIIKRLQSDELLKWVEQFIEIIKPNIIDGNIINDIGCQVGQFYKGLVSKISCDFQYYGYDIESEYLEIFKKFFKNNKYKLFNFDIEEKNIEKCHISVMSATLEHCNLDKVLKNMLSSTKKMAILRTFLGEEYKIDFCKKEKAENAYKIQQFKFESIFSFIHNQGFSCKVLKDKATDSLPQFINLNVDGIPIVRTQYVLVCNRIKEV